MRLALVQFHRSVFGNIAQILRNQCSLHLLLFPKLKTLHKSRVKNVDDYDTNEQENKYINALLMHKSLQMPVQVARYLYSLNTKHDIDTSILSPFLLVCGAKIAEGNLQHYKKEIEITIF